MLREFSILQLFASLILNSLGSFMTELVQNIVNFAQGQGGGVKYMLFSGHDSTVGPLMVWLSILDCHYYT
jgi:hypothetical protein